MYLLIPTQVKYIINILNNNGYDGFAVGGCVRDIILKKTPSDWDITTNAKPSQIIECFKDKKIILNGLKHGTVAIILDHEIYEITTYRIDGNYTDGRHPDSVEFTTTLKADLQRRDFTINSLVVNSNANITDYFNGLQDINNKIIKCVGDPDKRFNEDSLRIMRALRFASVLGFNIEENTAKSIHKNKYLLNNISVERIATELNKLLIGQNAVLILKEYYDVFITVIPELSAMLNFNQNNPNHDKSLWEHTLCSIDYIDNILELKLTMFFHDIGKPICHTIDETGMSHYFNHPQYSEKITKTILKRLHYSNLVIDTVCLLVKNHDNKLYTTRKYISDMLNKLGTKNCKNLIKVKKADVMAQSSYNQIEKLKKIDDFEKHLNLLLEQKSCFSIKQLDINGKDLINIGITNGHQIGTTLNTLLNMVINEKIQNNKDDLLKEAKKINTIS